MCVALVIKHAMRVCRIQLSMACLAAAYFSTLSHKLQDFRETFIEPKTFVLIFSTILSEIADSKNNSARRYYNYT